MRIARLWIFATLIVVGLAAPPAVGRPAAPDAAAVVRIPRTLAGTIHNPRPGRIALPFAATHVAWSWRGEEEDPGIEIRSTGGTWEAVGVAHDLEQGRRHYTAVMAIGRVRSFEWRWKAPDGIKALTLDYLNTVDGPLRAAEVSRDAPAGQPVIVTRAEWGADESVKKTSGSCKRTFFPVQQLFVHHTAGANYDTGGAATMRAIYWYHTVRRGWCDLGYNFVIGWDGTIFEGRWARRYASWELHSSENRSGEAVAGAHVAGFNSGSVGISVMGNFTNVDAPPAVRRSLAELLAWESDRHDLDPLGRHVYRNPETGAKRRLPFIAGHRDAGATSCPGDRLYRALTDVRRDTATTMGPGKTSSRIILEPSARRVDFGGSVELAGALTHEDGAPLALAPVRLYTLEPGGEWTEYATLSTAPDGSFSTSLTPQTNLKVAAVYQGNPSVWGSQTPNVSIKVRPRVELSTSGGATDESGVVHFPAGTATVLLTGWVEPGHPGGPIVVRIQQVNPDGTHTPMVHEHLRLDGGSRYSYDFAVPGPANVYRAVVWFARDRDHAASSSSPVTFTVDE